MPKFKPEELTEDYLAKEIERAKGSLNGMWVVFSDVVLKCFWFFITEKNNYNSAPLRQLIVMLDQEEQNHPALEAAIKKAAKEVCALDIKYDKDAQKWRCTINKDKFYQLKGEPMKALINDFEEHGLKKYAPPKKASKRGSKKNSKPTENKFETVTHNIYENFKNLEEYAKEYPEEVAQIEEEIYRELEEIKNEFDQKLEELAKLKHKIAQRITESDIDSDSLAQHSDKRDAA